MCGEDYCVTGHYIGGSLARIPYARTSRPKPAVPHPPIYVISDDPTAGRETGEGLGVEVRRVCPVWGMAWSAAEYFDELTRAYRLWERVTSPGEFGCTRAHLTCYEQIVSDGRGGLIFEADMALDPAPVGRALTVIERAKAGVTTGGESIDFIHFAVMDHQREGAPLRGWWDEAHGLYRVDPGRLFWGACSYYVSPTMAQAMIDYHAAGLHIADPLPHFFLRRPEFTPWHYPLFQHTFAPSHLEGQRLAVRKRSTLERLHTAIRGRLNRAWLTVRLLWASRLRYGRIPAEEKR